MSNEYLVNEFEEAILEKMNSEDECTIEDYDAARNALFDAVDPPNPAKAVIDYIMNGNNVEDNDDAMAFLSYWNEGKFDVLRRNWNNIPDEVFIGADAQFVPGGD